MFGFYRISQLFFITNKNNKKNIIQDTNQCIIIYIRQNNFFTIIRKIKHLKIDLKINFFNLNNYKNIT